MRKITQTDAPKIAQLLRVTGLDHNPDAERIARVSLESNHVTLVETTAEGTLIGFVDAFSTAAQDGTLRWEVDLLGVHPAHRGRGLARTLVSAAVDAGIRAHAYPTRALVKIDNMASLKAFQASGFTLDPAIYDLYISSDDAHGELTSPADTHLISVATLTYSGVWIEGNYSVDAFHAAKAVRTHYGWDIAGAVLPEGLSTAAEVDYQWIGKYHWLSSHYYS